MNRYGLIFLMASLPLFATPVDDLTAFIKNPDAEQFKVAFERFQTDASVSDQEKQDAVAQLTHEVHTTRAALEQEATLPTDKTRKVKGAAQLIGGALVLAHGIFATGPITLYMVQHSLIGTDYGKGYFCTSDDELRACFFPCRQIYNLNEKWADSALSLYTSLVTAVAFAMPWLCARGYKHITYKSHIPSKRAALEAIEQLLIARNTHEHGRTPCV